MLNSKNLLLLNTIVITPKTEQRPTKQIFKITAQKNNPRELYLIDFYAIDNAQHLSRIIIGSIQNFIPLELIPKSIET